MRTLSNSTLPRRAVLKAMGAGLVLPRGVRSDHHRSGTAGESIGFEDLEVLDEFLDERAAFKAAPVWDGVVVDLTGRAVVEVDVGTMTAIDHPDLSFATGPYAFGPAAVAVDPGTTVRWSWVPNPLLSPVPHDVVAVDVLETDEETHPASGDEDEAAPEADEQEGEREDDEANDEQEVDHETDGEHEHANGERGTPLFRSDHADYREEPSPFEFVFDAPGQYLYYCTAHGAPFEVTSHLGEPVYNEFGMRGAVVVTDSAG